MGSPVSNPPSRMKHFFLTIFVMSTVSTNVMLSTCDQSIEAIKAELKEEMREEMRRSEDRLIRACELRIETPFAVYDEKFNQKIDDLRTQMTTRLNQIEEADTRLETRIGGHDTKIEKLQKKIVFAARKTSPEDNF